ncbi:C2 calcium-dependent domain-containing protein 4C [Parambassis ranga]|uniref:C2 calcium-dependent domain-containing protein 4C n=1 Tax=Parambassis ranga TaxID=210632 RepID=A0A6P7IZK2_9TELE|nr:C2 calcium-dependent domain-containing protein 4C-like [Parambassis ranga]
MWVFGKIRESMESIPLELSRYMAKSEEDIFVPPKTGITQNLHSNILTPDKIPEFCLPPRLCKRSPHLEAEKTPPYKSGQNKTAQSSTSSHTSQVMMKNVETKDGDISVAWKATKKSLPFSAEVYGLAGMYESPNTRRKESLFHAKRPVYLFDRSIPTAAPRPAKAMTPPKKTLSGFSSFFSSRSLSGSTESETPSSSDSSPLSSPYSVKSSLYIPSSSPRLKGASSCPSLTDSKVDRGRWKTGDLSLTTSTSIPLSFCDNSLTLAPPVLFPLDVLQCQERLQREHVLPLQGRGRVRLSAEHTCSSRFSSLSTVRVRVVSVEGLWDDTDRHTLNCAVNLSLTPGKLQQQWSATIKDCRSPLFNEDFFFTELTHKDLLQLQLRVKVVNKPAAVTLRRVTVIGIISKPLSQLLPINK